MKDADRARAKRTIVEMADFGHSLVTLLLAGDRDGAAELMLIEFPPEDGNDPRLVALTLVMGDLVAFVHQGWAGRQGLDPADAWRVLMEQLAGWRATQERP